jgi:hypothetical protein
MTLAIVDPLGDYNTDNSTSWVANDAGAKCTYLPGAGEFWLLLETGTGPTASGSPTRQTRISCASMRRRAITSRWPMIRRAGWQIVSVGADRCRRSQSLVIAAGKLRDDIGRHDHRRALPDRLELRRHGGMGNVLGDRA